MYGNVYRAVQDPTIVGQRLLDHAKIHRWLDVSAHLDITRRFGLIYMYDVQMKIFMIG